MMILEVFFNLELPINVMIVMFVAIIVAGAFIGFSQNALVDAQKDLSEISNLRHSNGIIEPLEFNSITDNIVLSLATMCLELNSGRPDKAFCFSARSTSSIDVSIPADSKVQFNSLDFDVKLNTQTGAGTKALFFYYDPMGEIIVEG